MADEGEITVDAVISWLCCILAADEIFLCLLLLRAAAIVALQSDSCIFTSICINMPQFYIRKTVPLHIDQNPPLLFRKQFTVVVQTERIFSDKNSRQCQIPFPYTIFLKLVLIFAKLVLNPYFDSPNKILFTLNKND